MKIQEILREDKINRAQLIAQLLPKVIKNSDGQDIESMAEEILKTEEEIDDFIENSDSEDHNDMVHRWLNKQSDDELLDMADDYK